MDNYIFAGLPAKEQKTIKSKTDFNRIDSVVEAVCKVLNVSKKDIKSASRKRECTEPRQIAIGLLLNGEEKKVSLKKIGEYFSGRDHSTIIYNKEVFMDMTGNNKPFIRKVEKVKSYLKI